MAGIVSVATPGASAGGDVVEPGADRSQPRIELSANEVLVEKQVVITVSGLRPRQAVRLRLSLDRFDGRWTSQASFKADGHGRVRVAETAPSKGDYSGVDPMGLFWSARPQPDGAQVGAQVQTPQEQGRLTAEVDGREVASADLVRHYLRDGVTSRAVREQGLVGTLFEPAGPGPHPALLALGGSEGGLGGAEVIASRFANHGYVALALAYFDSRGQLEGLPRELSLIPLELFATAIEWLRSQPAVDGERIGVVGGSRGAELALLVASENAEIHAVVAYAPGHVVFEGLRADFSGSGQSTWSRAGQPLAFVPTPIVSGVPLENFRSALDNAEAVSRATIPVERINGGVLLVSGDDDQIWPASEMADEVVMRLRESEHPHPYRHLSYRSAGHLIVPPYQPTTALDQPPGSPFSLGGEPAGAARAARDHWPKVLRFLDNNL